MLERLEKYLQTDPRAAFSIAALFAIFVLGGVIGTTFYLNRDDTKECAGKIENLNSVNAKNLEALNISFAKTLKDVNEQNKHEKDSIQREAYKLVIAEKDRSYNLIADIAAKSDAKTFILEKKIESLQNIANKNQKEAVEIKTKIKQNEN